MYCIGYQCLSNIDAGGRIKIKRDRDPTVVKMWALLRLCKHAAENTSPSLRFITFKLTVILRINKVTFSFMRACTR